MEPFDVRKEPPPASRPISDYTIELPGGKSFWMSAADEITRLRFLDLPVPVRIRMLGLSNADLKNHLIEYRESLVSRVRKILSLRWYYRMDDGIFELEKGDIKSVEMDAREILKSFRRKKNVLTEKQLETIINWFESDTSEVKTGGF